MAYNSFYENPIIQNVKDTLNLFCFSGYLEMMQLKLSESAKLQRNIMTLTWEAIVKDSLKIRALENTHIFFRLIGIWN